MRPAFLSLPCAETQGDLSPSDLIGIDFLHLWWYVTAVYAIKLRNNIFLATWTIHSLFRFSFCSLFSDFYLRASSLYYLRAGCVPDLPVKRNTECSSVSFSFQDREDIRLVKSVEGFDQKGD
jgi:hypothetical protein